MDQIEAVNQVGAALGQKKPYQAPILERWGSIDELTQGPINGTIDQFAGGSGGT